MMYVFFAAMPLIFFVVKGVLMRCILIVLNWIMTQFQMSGIATIAQNNRQNLQVMSKPPCKRTKEEILFLPTWISIWAIWMELLAMLQESQKQEKVVS